MKKANENEMVSFGGGVNSVAMLIELVEQDWHGPVVFADLGNEHPETYCYMNFFEREFLKPRGLNITHISPITHKHLYDDKRLGGLANTLEEYCLKRSIIPLLSVRWCSFQWKRTPLENWRKEQGIKRTCVGMSIDESRRVRDDPAVRYPLIEEDISRAECHRIIAKAGLDSPRKSGCFFCPGQKLSQWRDLYLQYPELYERAIAMEDNASEKNQKWATLDPHGVPLREMQARRWQGHVAMDLSQWLPCVCKL
jgi:hypothetical protein